MYIYTIVGDECTLVLQPSWSSDAVQPSGRGYTSLNIMSNQNQCQTSYDTSLNIEHMAHTIKLWTHCSFPHAMCSSPSAEAGPVPISLDGWRATLRLDDINQRCKVNKVNKVATKLMFSLMPIRHPSGSAKGHCKEEKGQAEPSWTHLSIFVGLNSIDHMSPRISRSRYYVHQCHLEYLDRDIMCLNVT